jgi:chromosome segregation ATPase
VKALAAAQAELKAAQTQLAAQSAERDQLRQQLTAANESAQTGSTRLTAQLAALQQERDAALAGADETRRQVAGLNEQLESARRQLAAAGTSQQGATAELASRLEAAERTHRPGAGRKQPSPRRARRTTRRSAP